MSDDSIPRSILILSMLFVAIFFAFSETALTSCNKIRMKVLADDGDRRAQRVVRILEVSDRTLIAILIGTNIAQVALSSAATVMAIYWFGASGGLIATVVVTIVVFLFGESIPKNIAKANSDAISLFVSLPIWIIVQLLLPLEYAFIGFTTIVKKWIGQTNQPSMTEDEFSSIIETVEEEGIIEPEEGQIIRSAIEFSDITVAEIMLPLEKIVAIPLHASQEEIRETVFGGRYSRIPVYQDHINNIVGIMSAKKILRSILKKEEIRLDQNLRDALFVDQSMHVDDVFELMSRKRSHIAIVGKKGKQTRGLVTMEDILEKIVGDFYDELDLYDETMQSEECERGESR